MIIAESATAVWLLLYSLNGRPYIPYPKARPFYSQPECRAAKNMLETQSRLIRKFRIRLRCEQARQKPTNSA